MISRFQDFKPAPANTLDQIVIWECNLTFSKIKKSRPDLQLDPTQSLNLCRVLQEYFKNCSVEVANDQKKLETRIHQTEVAAVKTFTQINTHGVSVHKINTDFKEVDKILNQVNQVNENLGQLIRNIHYLNNLLPLDVRLEPPPYSLPSLIAENSSEGNFV